MMNLVRLFSALAVVAVATGCGTGFIDGWRDESEAPKKQPSLDLTDVTNEEQCKQVPDAGWFDDKCIAYADADEAQCASIADWAWLDGKCRTAAEVACIASGRAYVNGQCLDRPTLSADGDLSQSIVAGFAIEPIALTITPGAFAKLSDETCPGFFKINGGKVESGDGMALAGDVTSCRATVTANNQFAASDSLTISVKLEDGFSSLCKRGDQNKTVRAIRYALVGDDGDLSCSAIGATS